MRRNHAVDWILQILYLLILNIMHGSFRTYSFFISRGFKALRLATQRFKASYLTRLMGAKNIRVENRYGESVMPIRSDFLERSVDRHRTIWLVC